MKRKLLVVVLVVMMLVVIPTVGAQDEIFVTATMIWDSDLDLRADEEEYSYFISAIFNNAEFANITDIEEDWVLIKENNGGLFDYIAVFGLNGYELVSTITRGKEMIFFFQKSGTI